MKKIFDTKDARSTSKDYNISNLNFQRQEILKRIEAAAKRGQTFLRYSDELGQGPSAVILEKEDIKFLQSLGYRIEYPTIPRSIRRILISW